MLKVGAIVLAAGFSSRMGENKLLLKASGECMIVTTVSQLVRANLREVIVVTGHQREEIERALRGCMVRFASCDDFSRGMGRSLAVGINALSKELDGALICLGDMPFVKTNQIEAVIRTFEGHDGGVIVAPIHDGRRGHPVLFPQNCFMAMAKLDTDAGARDIIYANRDILIELEIDSADVLKDVDDPVVAKQWGYK